MPMGKTFSISMALVVLVVLGAQWVEAASVADISLYKGKDRQSKIEEGAKKEGEIVWYTSLAVEDSAQAVQLFEKRYPFVKIKLTRLTSERVLQRYLTEFQANRFFADIIDTNDFQMELPRRKGTLQAFYTPSVEKYDKRFLQPQGFWIASRLTMIVSAYNTRAVPRNEAPRKYEDLLDPKWKG
jgi:iron(III) transport system substrate-binding protein